MMVHRVLSMVDLRPIQASELGTGTGRFAFVPRGL